MLDALDTLSGLHPGFRPAHAKGLMCSGTFTPSPEAAKLTRAPHASRPSTPVTVRYSDSTGVPTIPDNDPAAVRPARDRRPLPPGRPRPHRHRRPLHQRLPRPHRRGVPGVPARRGRLRGGQARGDRRLPRRAPQRQAVRRSAQADPDQLRPGGVLRRHVLQVHQRRGRRAATGGSASGPKQGTEYLSDEQAAAKSANFLFDEIGPRLAQGPVRLGVFVQLAGDGDDVTDASVPWPESRAEIPFGTITLTARVDDQEPERRKIIFDPIPRVDGIDSSGDPLTEVRSEIYLLSGRRRRAAAK